MPNRLNQDRLNIFASRLADLQLDRNPLAEEVVLIFNDVIRDHYQDAISSETLRIKKQAVVKKNEDMHYVQQEEAILLEDTDSIPWVISITTTDLPRLPRMDDQILIEGLRYNIAQVKPSNRAVYTIILLYVYPERNDVDPLHIYKVSDLHDGYLDIVYGGNPVSYSFDQASLYDESLRLPFVSRVPFTESIGTIFIFDSETFARYEYTV